MDHHSPATNSRSSPRRWSYVRVTPYAPWANGAVEHFMRNLGKVLETFNVENQDWRSALNALLKFYRAIPHSTTREPPAFLLFNGRPYHTKLPDAEQQTPLAKEEEVQNTDIWNEIKRGIPQGSILGPLLFNVFINDIFMFIEKSEICNFADDNTIYDCGEDLSNILENLKHDMKILLKWFRTNSLQANPGKFQSMILGKEYEIQSN